MRKCSRMSLDASDLDCSEPRVDAEEVIPTLLLAGLLFGRWWKIAIPVAVLGWPILLIATGVDSGLQFALEAGAFAAANVIVGVLAYRAVALAVGGVAALARRVGS